MGATLETCKQGRDPGDETPEENYQATIRERLNTFLATDAEKDRLRAQVALLNKALDRERAKVRVLEIRREIEKLLEERDDLADEYGLPTPWLHS